MELTLFQSAPVIADGRAGVQRQGCALPLKFQSAPVIADGRAVGFAGRGRTPGRFNPRPSSLTGEHQTFYTASPVELFQSAPVIADGRAGAAGGVFHGLVVVSIRARHR